MSESKKQLIAEKERVFDESGAHIATVWEKYPNEERLPGESWLEMRERTQSLRDVAAQEAISRARQFSAAPELVEAAKIGLQYIEAVCFNTPNPKKRANYADAASKIRAALAKAGA
ncbi:hypothetical protein B7759_01364 [Burkholderia glumae]|uniref:hypothetical protein n=1 Tax=Burkholderia glumae TaxID=337 RepID=UPI001AE5591E|nr:hypothetical protein [Burkholderia glumae]QTP32786.1 hypothetical protein B7759_01364 [Burkholderia glumae]